MATTTSWLKPPDKDYEAAKHEYVEIYGSALSLNTSFKVAILVLGIVALGLVGLNIKTYNAFHHLQPLVIRINELGRAEAVNYGSLEYHPQEAEIKFFLIQFAQLHYGRMRATLKENYTRSLYFLDGRLADALIQANKKSNALESFLTTSNQEIDIDVKNVAIEDLRKPPYKATVEFEKVYYATADHAETRRERYVANFVFVVKEPVPNALIPINPLGLTITYFREDQAF